MIQVPSGPGGPGRRIQARRFLTVVALVATLAGCGGAPILANAPLVLPVPPTATPAPSSAADPRPIVLPRDDGPHDRLTEWWYYTGHLLAENGDRFGFEAVIFRAERGAVPTSWAAHLALTDERGGRFLYAQRSEIGSQVDRSPRAAAGDPTGFDLAIAGFDPTNASSPGGTPWRLAGSDGVARIEAELSPAEAAASGGAFGLNLDLETTKPPALHDRDGWIDFGPAGGSYYYSRTHMAATGTLEIDGETLAVTGLGWFDHQWGDFISVGGGGWDWFALNLDDGTDVTMSLVRAPDGSYPLVYGTTVDRAGRVRHLGADDFSIVSTGTWTSTRTGAIYPAGWRVELPTLGLTLELEPTVADQELDTRATTAVVYWEGSQRVTDATTGAPLGVAYVELTGYALQR